MRATWACLALAACSPGAGNNTAGGDLEAAAIATGAIPDPATAPVEGLYEHVGEAATDRLCLVGSGDDYRIGLNVYVGRDSVCTARGSATRKGETLKIELEGKEDCAFTAAFDGEQVSIPGAVPRGCAAYCLGETSIAGVALSKSSSAKADALAARDGTGLALCGDD